MLSAVMSAESDRSSTNSRRSCRRSSPVILADTESVGPIARDPEADVFVGIRLLAVDLGDQPLGSFNLLQLLGSRREPDLLISKFAQFGALIFSLHGPPLLLLRSPPTLVVVFLANPSPTAVSFNYAPQLSKVRDCSDMAICQQ